MSFADAQIAIENRFATGFTAAPIKYENVKYTPSSETSFVEIKVVEATSVRADIGPNNPLHRTFGLININIFTPVHIGAKTGRALADLAAGVFRDAKFSGITCRSPLVRNVGDVENWFAVNCSIEFFRDEIHTT